MTRTAHPVHRSFRLTRPTTAVSIAQQVRPAIVLQEREGRELLAAAAGQDVGAGGCYAAGPAGVQLWSGPFNGAGGTHGSARHLGSVDWSYDTPSRHWITIYRVLLTADGAAAGLSAEQVLDRVLGLAGVRPTLPPAALPVPPPRDPFRRGTAWLRG